MERKEIIQRLKDLQEEIWSEDKEFGIESHIGISLSSITLALAMGYEKEMAEHINQLAEKLADNYQKYLDMQN